MRKVDPITPIDINSDQLSNPYHDQNASYTAKDFEMDQDEHKEHIHLKTFQDILSNSPNQISVSKYLFYGGIRVVIIWV